MPQHPRSKVSWTKILHGEYERLLANEQAVVFGKAEKTFLVQVQGGFAELVRQRCEKREVGEGKKDDEYVPDIFEQAHRSLLGCSCGDHPLTVSIRNSAIYQCQILCAVNIDTVKQGDALMVKLKLEEVLKKKKISKRGFAKMLGIDYSNVFRFFREDYNPKLSVLAEWAHVLGVEIGSLYEESQRPSKHQIHQQR